MTALTLRGLAARKLRTALTAIAVVLGVGLISGTYILTDTINRSFDSIFETANKKIDVVVSPREAVSGQDGASPPAFPASTLARVQRVPGVGQASGGVFNIAQIYGKNGDKLGAQGAPNFVGSVQPGTFSPYTYVQGRPPTTATEVALDRNAVDKGNYKLGDKVAVAGQEARKTYTLVGVAKFGNQTSIAGASIAIMALAEAQRVLGEVGQLDQIDVKAAPGTRPQALVGNLRRALPASVTVRTGEQQARQQAKDTKQGFSFITTVLLIFAGVVLFVGAFMIFNTFSITVAQRMREFAMLRTVGASRAQVLRSVVLESLLIGIGASILGLALGLALAPGLRALFSLLGGDLPAEGTVIEPRTIVVSLLVGTVLTVVSSLLPALRSTRVPPIAALREGAVLPRGRAARFRTPLAILGLLLGAGLIVLGLFAGASGGGSASLLGLGAAVIFLAVAMLARYVVRPLASAVGLPMERIRGVTGRLARENATRNSGRTAATAAALMIGMALVTFVTILAAGIKDSVASSVDKGLTGAFVVQNTDGQSPIPAATAGALAKVPGIGTVVETRFAAAKVRGVKGNANVTGVDPRTLPSIYRVEWKKGSDATLRTLGPTGAVVSDKWAKDHDVKVGQTLTVLTPKSTTVRLTVRGTYKDDAQLLTDVTVTNQVIVRDFGAKDVQVALAGVKPGQSVDVVKKRAEAALKDRFPSVEVLTKKEFTDDVAGQVNKLLSLFYVLLGLAVIVSLFGIVNTLALSIYERTRELGMVRAIGMSRRQVRTMVRYESVITALIGAVLGLVLGVVFAIAMTPPLADQGLKISIPVGTLIVLLILAALAGVLAAIGPARRASRLDVLEALAYE
jgi:putative ABC transport system permease protein